MRTGRDRPAIVLGAMVVVSWALIAAALLFFQRARNEVPLSPPFARSHALLSSAPTREVFGSGEGVGVTVNTGREVRFGYLWTGTVKEAWPAYVVLVARGLTRDDQIEVRLNEKPLGFLKAKTGPQRVELPMAGLESGQVNAIAFRSVDSARAAPWSIGRVCALNWRSSEMNDGMVLGRAAWTRAQVHLLGAGERLENRELAWNDLRDATYYLATEGSEAPLLQEAEAALKQLDDELAQLCDKFLLTGMDLEETKDASAALAEYRQALKFFPAGDEAAHPCHARLLERIEHLANVPSSKPQ